MDLEVAESIRVMIVSGHEIGVCSIFNHSRGIITGYLSDEIVTKLGFFTKFVESGRVLGSETEMGR